MTDRRDVDVAYDVIVSGAGPSGLMLANLLGRYGLTVLALETGPRLIDFPRGVGMDDETLRSFQLAGLVDEVLPHTVPHQLLVFVDAKQRTLARLAPPTSAFGWPRRNGFVQPEVDRVLLRGLDRFGAVQVSWSTTMLKFTQDDHGVDVLVATPGGEKVVRAQFLVGADGGRSATRKELGVEFAGSSASEDWLVMDIRNDPLGRPGAYVCADPRRPYVSISIPHGIRRFEFMLLPGETAELATSEEFTRRLLAPLVHDQSRLDVIRRRVYTHHSRVATRFRDRRVLLVGDAAHVMPVWQGQGYNSGIRDAVNLAWKLAAVAKGMAADTLLDTYDQERRDHVTAMVDLSTWVGRAVSITHPALATARNLVFRGLGAVPAAKNYIVQMRFKPMPTMRTGAITRVGTPKSAGPVGQLFHQPLVRTVDGDTARLDDAVGPWFSLIAWNNDPLAVLDGDSLRRLRDLGAVLVQAVPQVQLRHLGSRAADGVRVVGDVDGTMKRWFEEHAESVVLVRPDRIVGGAAPAYAASAMVRDFFASASLEGLDTCARVPALDDDTGRLTWITRESHHG